MAKNKSKIASKYNIICLSNQLWDFPNWTNKRLVMQRLAKLGHNVLFVDPPINTGRLFFRQIKDKKWDLKRLTKNYYIDKTGAVICTPLNVIPFGNITSLSHIEKIKHLSKKFFNKKRPILLWVYHVQLPYLENYLKKLDYDFLIYDCVDNYGAFPENKMFFSANVPKEKVLMQEKALAESANVVFATAPGLVDKLKKYNQRVYYTPNVGDYKRFKNTKSYKYQIPKQLDVIPRPRIGMIGALDEYKFDANLIKRCATDHPNYSFVLIGPFALKDKDASLKSIGLDEFKNVYYLGSTPWEQKKYYMAGFDVDIIPYQLNDYTVGGCFPVKFHDSLAAGLPVVVTDLPAYAPFSDVCYISKSYDEFSSNLKRALDEDNDARIKQRQEVAKQNDWDGKVDHMIEIINSNIF